MNRKRGLAGFVLILTTMSLSLIVATAVAQEIDLVLLVDESSSVCRGGGVALEIDGLIWAFNDLILPAVEAGATIRMAVVSFGTHAIIRVKLVDVATNKSTIIAALNAIKRRPECGSTNMKDAIRMASSLLSSSTAARKAINLVSDGLPDFPSATLRYCAQAKAAGYELWTLGIGDTNEAFLNGCAGPPPARNFQVASFSDFAAAEREKLGQIIPAPAEEEAPEGPLLDCITADYKRDLVQEALSLKDDIRDLIDSLRTDLIGDNEDNLLLCTKSWIIRARKEIEARGNAVTVQNKIQSAQTCKQSAYAGFPRVGEIIDDLESSINSIALDMDAHISTGDITEDEVIELRDRYLVYLLERLTEKRVLLIEMDRELEQVDEHLVEAAAFVGEGNFRDAEEAINAAEREIKKVIGKVWEFKENMKYVMGYTQGFIVAVLNAPLMPPPPQGPYYPPHGLGAESPAMGVVGVIPLGSAIRFATSDPGVEGLRVQVFNLAGAQVFDSGFVTSNTFEWRLMDNYGDIVANGIYLYVITVRGPDGETISSEVKKLAIVR